jgi:hypothetical protein
MRGRRFLSILLILILLGMGLYLYVSWQLGA